MELTNAGHVRRHAEMWRITADLWDSWDDVVGMFAACDQWSAHVGEGRWPDADMLPIGRLAIRSSERGEARRGNTRLTDTEVGDGVGRESYGSVGLVPLRVEMSLTIWWGTNL